MIRNICFILLYPCLLWPQDRKAGQDTIVAEALTSCLPAVDEIRGWAPAGQAEFAAGDDLYLLINGGAGIFHEYGFRAALFQSYISPRDHMIHVEIYRMKDAQAAYGIYSFKTGSGGRPFAAGQGGWFESYYLNFYKGRYLVTLIGTKEISEIIKGIETIARAIDDNIEPVASEPPEIIRLLPKEQLQPSSAVYLRGSISLFNQYIFAAENIFNFKEGVSGNYGSHSLFLLRYDDPRNCKRYYIDAKKYLKQSPRFTGFADLENLFKITDKENRIIDIYLYLNYILIYIGDHDENKGEILSSVKQKILIHD